MMIIIDCVGSSDVFFFFFFQAEDGIRDYKVTGVQTCALPISDRFWVLMSEAKRRFCTKASSCGAGSRSTWNRRRKLRSEEHTSELQSPCNLVCRLLLEKKKKQNNKPAYGSSDTYVYTLCDLAT